MRPASIVLPCSRPGCSRPAKGFFTYPPPNGNPGDNLCAWHGDAVLAAGGSLVPPALQAPNPGPYNPTETETPTMPDLSAFTFTAENVPIPPDAPTWAGENGARAWWVTISRGAEMMSLHYYQGSAHVDPPTLADVLVCVCSDASYDDPDELTDGLPYSQARRIVEAVERQTAELRDLLGDDFDAFVYPDEYDGPGDPLAGHR